MRKVTIISFFCLMLFTAAENRSFKMGFSTWIYAPTLEAINGTNEFLKNNGDFYTEQIDEHLPWNELLNGSKWPDKFMENINGRLSRRIKNNQLLLALTPLNDDRNGILKNIDGTVPDLRFGSPKLIDAYYTYCEKMVSLFKPDYLLIGIESNELLKKQPQLWKEYLIFSSEVFSRLKKKYPSLPISQSVTLHVLINPEVKTPTEYRRKISSFTRGFDFFGVSFYPHFLAYKTEKQFQSAFDYLHKFTRKPIAFTETANIAETVDIPKYKIVLESTPAAQKDYLETLFTNAHKKQYLFVSWWAHRDCDKLVDIFPAQVRDLGRIFQDTGIVDEEGRQRPSYKVWQNEFRKSYKR